MNKTFNNEIQKERKKWKKVPRLRENLVSNRKNKTIQTHPINTRSEKVYKRLDCV